MRKRSIKYRNIIIVLLMLILVFCICIYLSAVTMITEKKEDISKIIIVKEDKQVCLAETEQAAYIYEMLTRTEGMSLSYCRAGTDCNEFDRRFILMIYYQNSKVDKIEGAERYGKIFRQINDCMTVGGVNDELYGYLEAL